MNTPELRMILENCFSREALGRQLRGAMETDDPYEAAINAILAEDEEGAALTHVLDMESAPQRAKVSSLNAKALRDSLVVEFLEPGHTLGLILWALLRDNRIGVRSLAGVLTEEILKRRTQEEELGQEEQSILEESEEDLNRFLTDLESNDLELYSEEEIDHLLDVEPLKLEEDPPQTLEQESQEPLEDLTEDEVQNLLSSIDENRSVTDQDEEIEEASPEVSFQDDVLQDDILQDEELQDKDEDLDKLIAELQQESQERRAEEELSPGEYAFEQKEWTTEDHDDSTINLGGIEISRSSLRQACERIFKEPVELVTDENLILQEKIVVIGRECGFRVLNGPNYQVQKPKMEVDPSSPVMVSSGSLCAALSRIYGEPVELVPDPRLLEQGIAVIAGMKTGIALVRQPMTRITLPDWAEGMELSQDVTQPAADESILTDLKERVAFLENILKELASDHLTEIPAPLPVPEPILLPEKPAHSTSPLQTEPTHVPASVETPYPLAKPEEDHLSHETIALEEIETEELEPVLIDHKEENEEDEIEFDEDLEIDEDILAALSSDEEESETGLMENHEEANEKTDHLTLDDDLDDLNLEGLDLDALTSGLDDEEEEDGDTSLKLGDESNEEPMISLGEDEDSEDELNLDDLDLSEDDLDLDGLNLGGEDSDDDELGAVELEDENLDLDILKELELDDKSKDRPKKVFNGDFILLLGGDEKHRRDYDKMLKELGASGEWHGRMNNMDDGEINELVERADMIMTLSTNALADPGIMQAANYAQSMNKRYFQHHSASPNSIRKKLVQLVEEGQV